MRKRFLLSLLVLLLTTLSLHAYDFQSGDLYYTITSATTVEVTYQEYQSASNYQGLTTATIPETITYDGSTYSVTSIGWFAFNACSSLTSITIPNSVTSIGDQAFNGCSSLTSITLPNSVTSIDHYAFRGCTSLTSITIPNSVTSIGWSAFSGCSSLTSITIPNSVTTIGNYAFNGCSSLTSVIWNAKNCAGWIYVSDAPFYGIRANITSFTFGEEVETIHSYLCYGMSSLTSVTLPNSVTSIGKDAFEGCSSLTSITIPNSVTSIGDYAFNGCSSLTSITLGNSVTSIGYGAFYRCSSLTSIVVESGNTMYDSRENCNAIIETASNTLIAGCQSTTIPNSVTSIGKDAFEGCSSLTSITIPNSVTSIGDYAFYDCSSLADIYCHATTPPMCETNTFEGVSKNCYIHVPAGTVQDYQLATGWSEFIYYYEIEEEEQAIQTAEQQSKPSRKIIRNGQVLILRNGVTYDMMGQTL